MQIGGLALDLGTSRDGLVSHLALGAALDVHVQQVDEVAQPGGVGIPAEESGILVQLECSVLRVLLQLQTPEEGLQQGQIVLGPDPLPSVCAVEGEEVSLGRGMLVEPLRQASTFPSSPA